MKAAGVTTVIMLGDFSMNKALMDNATKQQWYPEWFFTGAVYADIGTLARIYPQEQSQHAFGLSFLTPFTELDPPPAPPALPLSTQINPLNWYFGVNAATQSGAIITPVLWVLAGIHTAGPNLTPKTFAQGLFSVPPAGGAAQNRVSSTLSGYGKGPNLPYDEYASNGLDFAPYWWDPNQTGPSNGQGEVGKGVGWYANGAKRYVARRGPRSSSTGSTRTRPSTTSRPVRVRSRCTRVTARKAARRPEPAARRAPRAGRRSCSRRTERARPPSRRSISRRRPGAPSASASSPRADTAQVAQGPVGRSAARRGRASTARVSSRRGELLPEAVVDAEARSRSVGACRGRCRSVSGSSNTAGSWLAEPYNRSRSAPFGTGTPARTTSSVVSRAREDGAVPPERFLDRGAHQRPIVADWRRAGRDS